MNQTFQIWREGWAATCEHDHAALMGTAHGESFAQACNNFFESRPDLAKNYNANQVSWWACRLFPTEQEARKSFG